MERADRLSGGNCLEACQLAPVDQLDPIGSGEFGAARGEALVRDHECPVTLPVRAGGGDFLHGAIPDRSAEQLALHDQPVHAALRDQIRARTGSDAVTSGILRSIERFGDDPSILRYEVSPTATTRFGVPYSSVAWSVRAVRS